MITFTHSIAEVSKRWKLVLFSQLGDPNFMSFRRSTIMRL